MELTPEQIQEFEAITDYSQKLKWWQERFGYDLTPRSPNMTIVPQSIEETKLLIDWYGENYSKRVSTSTHRFDFDNWGNLIGQDLHKLSKEEKIEYLLRKKSDVEQFFTENGTLVDIRNGVKFEDNPQLGLKKFFKSIREGDNLNEKIWFFFVGHYNKRLLDIISDFLTDYPEVNPEVNDDIETIHFDHFSHKVALLQELGVIDHLRAKYNIREVDNKKMIPILAAIMGIEDKRVIEALRKIVSSIGTNDKNNPTKSEKSKLFIRGVLAKLDLSIN